jgi:hypothetical protein
LQQASCLWSNIDGNRYRAQYDTYTFAEKQAIYNTIISSYNQHSGCPYHLFEYLGTLNHQHLNIFELGGYDGFHAYNVFLNFPHYRWVNYDLSLCVAPLTRPQLLDYNYRLHILDEPFTTPPDDMDLFYTSYTLEHLRLHEVLDILDATRHILHHVHLIDYVWADDTHVLELDSEDAIIQWYQRHGFDVTTSRLTTYNNMRRQLRIWAWHP